MRDWLAQVWDSSRSKLWPIPTIAVVTAVVVGLGLPEIEASFGGPPRTVDRWLFGGDAEAARSVLSTIAASLTTVTALTFTLTVVTLQLASSQFSPRLLRTFSSDLFVQSTLALFLATFTYSVSVLRAVRGSGDDQSGEFVPAGSVTLAFVLAVSSVLGLVLFLAHLSAQVRVENVLQTVHREARHTMRTALSERDSALPRLTAPSPPPEAVQLASRKGGFVTRIEEDGLLRIAVEEDVFLSVDVYPGCFVVGGNPLGTTWAADGLRLDADRADDLAGRVAACLHTGAERTTAQDVGYGLRQLTDVANRALSPGINDPTTAIHALGHLSGLLCELTAFDDGPELLRERDGRVRVVLHRPDFARYVDLALSQPRHYGAGDPQVLGRIFEVLLELSFRVRPEQRTVVLDQLGRLRRTVDAQNFDPCDRAPLDDLGVRVEQTLRPGSHESDGMTTTGRR